MTFVLRHTPALSDRVRRPLREVARRQWIVAAGRGALQALAGTLGVLLALALLLGYLGLPVVLRIAVAAIAWAAILWLAARSLWPAMRRWSLGRAARQVERTLPHLDERLSSAVELMGEHNPAFRGSPQLVEHLVRQAEQDADAINPAAVVPMDSIVRWGLVFLPVLVAWLVLSVNGRTAQPVMRGLYSAVFPWRSHLPALLSRIQVQPGDVVLAQDDPLEITARVLETRNGKEQFAGGATLVRRFSTGQSLSQPLDATSVGDFHATLDHLQQSFEYCVKTDNGSSDWYTATVRPRPAVSRLDVHYDYPPYTNLGTRDDIGRDGNIDAIVGTKITLTLHTPEPPVLEKSGVVLDEGKREEQVLALAQAGSGEYRASFVVNHSGDYRIRLSNSYGLENKDNQKRAVTAQFDQVPSVTILLPAGQVTVRPDDVVPVEYLAADDFGIIAIQAMVQIDDQPIRTLALPLPSGDRRNVKGTWPIEIATLLQAAHVKDASRIAYQLKAIDNRDPDPQTGLSARQILIIDRGQWRSYADQLNDQRKRSLEEAIRKAINRLGEAEWRTNSLKAGDEKHILSPDERRDARDLRESLATTSKDLATAANDFLDTPFAQVAAKAKQIAETTIARSADDVARAEFNADAPADRRASADKAHLEVIEARDALNKLLQAADQAQKKFEAAEALQQAARKQQETAQEMALHPENVDPNRQKQQEAINKLNEAMQKDPSLQNPKARELAQELSKLTGKIEHDQQQQTGLQNAISKQQEAAQAKDAAKKIAKKQKELNDRIEQFANDRKDALKKSGADAPHKDQQDQIVQKLEDGNLHDAQEAMRRANDRLRDNAQRLKSAAKGESETQAAAGEADELGKKQDEIAKLVQPQERQLANAKNSAVPPDQAAQRQRDLAHETQDLKSAAQQLAEKSKEQKDRALARRAAAAEKALDHAAQAQEHAAQAQSDQHPDQAAEAQADAQQALSKADQALRGDPKLAQADPSTDQGLDQESAAKSDTQAGQEQSDASNAGDSSDQGEGKGSAKDSAQQAAQAAQEAAAAQQQALRPDPAAAQQAANALARAAAAAQRATQGQPDEGQASAGPEAGAKSAADADAGNGQKTSARPGQSADSSMGIQGESTGGNNAPPAAVQDLGISAGDWARLPPLMQRELMNAARQSGPPAYRQMIRDYYIRIAKMQESAGQRVGK